MRPKNIPMNIPEKLPKYIPKKLPKYIPKKLPNGRPLISILNFLHCTLGGGYPRGRVIEIYGPESSGKTTLALHAVAEIQKTGGLAVLHA